MRGGIDRSFCFLALLFVCYRAEDAVSSEDLKTGLPEEDSKSAALAQSLAFSEADSSENANLLSDPSGGSLLTKSAASAVSNAYTNGGQASALASAQSGVQDNLLRPGWSSAGLGGNSALAEAISQANGGVSGFQPLPYQPGYDLNSYGSSAQTQAEASANSGLGSSNLLGLNSYGSGNSYPLTLGPGSGSAQAKAEAHALTNSVGGGLYPGLNYPKGSGVSSAQAQAETQALNSAGHYPINPYQPGYQQLYQPVYPNQGSSAQAQAQAQAETLSQVTGGNLLGPNYPGYQYSLPLTPGLNSPNARANAQTISGGFGNFESNAHAQASANAQSPAPAFANAYSRVIPLHEYIIPHLIPGAEDIIACKRESELHYFWSPAYQCLVCTCIRDLGGFRPVCARCDGCKTPMPGPEPGIVPYPVTIAPIPPPAPLPQVTCDPLPSGQPFHNPLNPCQICVCRETVNWQGQPDVHIDCQQNPECVIAPDVTTLLPKPTPSEPITLPPFPVSVTVPIAPEPIPWPPATTPAPIPGPMPGPGPLPGPAPHESCRPYPPNTPFQHPWDECQVCVCSEAFSYGRVSIEVNCFTKKSCCYESPYPEPVTTAPGPYQPTPTIQIIDKICEYRSLGVEFINPTDKCSVCSCELQGNLVTSICRQSSAPECRIIYYAGGSGSSAEAKAQSGSLPSSYNPLNFNRPLTGGQSQATAETNALAQNSIQPVLQPQTVLQPWLQPELDPRLKPWHQSGVQHSQPELPSGLQKLLQSNPDPDSQYYQLPGRDLVQSGGSLASASAFAEAQSNQYQQFESGNISPLYNPLLTVGQGNNLNQNWLNKPTSVADAEAIQYNTPYLGNNLGTSQYQLPLHLGGNKLNGLDGSQFGGSQLGGSLLGGSLLGGSQLGGSLLGGGQLGGSLLGGGQLDGSLLGGSQLGGSLLGGSQLGGSLLGGGGTRSEGALAEIEALTNLLSPSKATLGQGSSASAEAKANTQTLLPGGGGSYYPGGSSSTFYQNPYLKQVYPPSSASSKAQAAASSNGQSQASASAIVLRQQGKSAQEDMELLDEPNI